jgi:hypothetical protein
MFTFPDPGMAGVSPPILGFHDVDFNYPGGPTLFKDLNFGLVSKAHMRGRAFLLRITLLKLRVVGTLSIA